MAEPTIQVGDKFHIITRRRFESDLRRHFAGEVVAVTGEHQMLRGYTFVFESGKNEFTKRPEIRTRLFDLGQEGFIVNKLPTQVDIPSLRYCVIDKHLVMTDDDTFVLDINEFGGAR
jgi:hypothetical protein